jgi:hypothetical protein
MMPGIQPFLRRWDATTAVPVRVISDTAPRSRQKAARRSISRYDARSGRSKTKTHSATSGARLSMCLSSTSSCAQRTAHEAATGRTHGLSRTRFDATSSLSDVGTLGTFPWPKTCPICATGKPCVSFSMSSSSALLLALNHELPDVIARGKEVGEQFFRAAVHDALDGGEVSAVKGAE